MAPTARAVVERNYEIGVQRSATVGESMVKLKRYSAITRNDVLAFTEQCRIWSTLNFEYFADEGSTLPVMGMRECGDEQCHVVKLPVLLSNGGPTAMQVNSKGMIVGPPINLMFNNFIIGAIKFEPQSCRLQEATMDEPPVDGTPYRNFEIIYSGLDAGSMKFSYREYTIGDMARPAFAQDFAYPQGSTEVRFREIVIDVADAQPAQITYAVRQDGG